MLSLPAFRFLRAPNITPSAFGFLLAALLPSAGASTQEDRAPLVPAAFGIRTDREGNSWSVEPNGNIGRIGNTMANSGLVLAINDEKFSGFQPMMTSDAGEFVFPGLPLESLPGLQIQRRVRLLDRPGGLRYAEMFFNGSTDPLTFTVSLTTSFSGNYKTFLSDRGRTEPLTFAESETAVVVLPGTSQSSKAFLFTLADTWTNLKPTISAQNRYGLTFRYLVTLDPGESGVIAHHVAQVVIPQSFDRLSLLNLSRPYSFRGIRDSFAEDWKGHVLNAGEIPGETMRSALLLGGVDSFGLSGGAKDLLAIGDQTRLAGDVEGGPILMRGRYEGLEIDLERVAAIVGKGEGDGGQPRVFLRDGQILSAPFEAPGLAFVQSGGSRIPLDPKSLDRLVRAETPNSSDWSVDSVALLETYEGDRLKVIDPGSFRIHLATPWGVLPVALENLVWMRPSPDGNPGHWVELKDGTRCFGYIRGESARAGFADLGDFSLETRSLRSIFTSEGLKQDTVGRASVTETVTRLHGNQDLVGPITNTEIPVISRGTRIDTATSEVRSIRRIDEGSSQGVRMTSESPVFQLERWDGGLIDGFLHLEFVSLKIGGRAWPVPVRDIQRIDNASPLLTPELQAKIRELILQLGSEEWESREKATKDLGAFGYLARPVLQRELADATDPEVGRRLERILSDLK